jgi:hypothetical protein
MFFSNHATNSESFIPSGMAGFYTNQPGAAIPCFVIAVAANHARTQVRSATLFYHILSIAEST